ncbi:hypothetical protein Cflav_PD3462 [Pedosphaera parvula Ellin514]|uniref:Uncharacterized protein n=1 Tax=Pedosphaera parvula (strain Ellin514) TaxID=320771 RepID=B9XHZ9_PEDPL|nr:hypothetical protein Cflav_PD3462 [Pedosphaera parvula Ellin514]
MGDNFPTLYLIKTLLNGCKKFKTMRDVVECGILRHSLDSFQGNLLVAHINRMPESGVFGNLKCTCTESNRTSGRGDAKTFYRRDYLEP